MTSHGLPERAEARPAPRLWDRIVIVNVSVRLGPLRGAVAIVAAVACTYAPRSWIVRFADGDAGLERDAAQPGVARDWDHIGLRVVSGETCPGEPPRSESDVPGPDMRGFDALQRVERGGSPAQLMPDVLPDGRYTVMAWAIDASEALYAWSCLHIASPATGTIVSELRSVPSPIALRGEWRVAFEDPATAARADRVYVRVQPGPCPATPPAHAGDRTIAVPSGARYVEAFARTSAAPAAFLAWADSDAECASVAYGCAEGPGPVVIETVMRALASPLSFCPEDPRACRASPQGLRCDRLIVASMALGGTSACFLTTTGDVFCDGTLEGGPLALPAGLVPERLFGRHARRSTIPSLDRADGYCALAADGRLACWGDAFPFADAPMAAPALIDRGALPSTRGRPLAVSLGLRMGCVVIGSDATGGEVWCRARSTDPLRDSLVGSSDPGEWAAPDAPFGAGADVLYLDSGALDTCASNGTLTWCWGDARVGLDVGYSPRLNLGAETERFVGVSVGEMHACALSDDGLVRCWGSDFSGQLAPRFAAPRPAGCTDTDYRRLREIPGDPCAAFALGESSLYMMEHAWVLRGSYDEAFNGGTVTFPPIRDPDTDEIVARLGTSELHASDLTSGAHHTCAISAEPAPTHPDDREGRVLCWGDDSLAQQVGGLTPDLASWYTRGGAAWVRLCDAAGDITESFLEDAIDVESGALGTCARTRSGEVLCWGGTDAATCAARPPALPSVTP